METTLKIRHQILVFLRFARFEAVGWRNKAGNFLLYIYVSDAIHRQYFSVRATLVR